MAYFEENANIQKQLAKRTKEIEKFKKDNPELYEKISGNLSSRQRVAVEKQPPLKIKFQELYNGDTTRFEKRHYADVTKEQLSRVVDVANEITAKRRTDSYDIYVMTDEQKDLAKELYNKFIDKGSTTIPYEKITPIYIKEGNSSPFIYFTTLDSDYAFDTRQDDNSLTHKFTKDDIDNTELLKDRKRIYAICTNELPDTSYFRSAYDHLLRVGFDKDYEYISNNNSINPENIKENLLEHTGEIFDNLKPVGASDKTFELYDKFSRERKTIREKLDDGYEIYEVSKGAKGISDIFKNLKQSSNYQLCCAVSGVYSEIFDTLSKSSKVSDNDKEIMSKLSEKFKAFSEDITVLDADTVYDADDIFYKYSITLDMNDFKEDIEKRLGYELPKNHHFIDFKNGNASYVTGNITSTPLELEVVEFHQDLSNGALNNAVSYMNENNAKTVKPRCNLLLIHPDSKKAAIAALNKHIEKKFDREYEKSVTYASYDGRGQHGKLEVILDKYKDVINVQKNLEHTVDQNLEYASIFNTKKNINVRTQEKMEKSNFNKYFNDVEFDNDVEFESFNSKKQIGRMEGKAAMDDLEKSISDIAPILKKAKCEDVSLKFRKLGNLQKKNHKGIVNGVYIPAHNCIAVDINNDKAYRSLVHEVGHRIDFTLEDKMLSSTRKFSDEVGSIYKQTYNRIANDGHHEIMKLSSLKDYFTSGTEIFARSYEFALQQQGIASDFTKSDEDMKNCTAGYIFNEMTEDEKQSICDYMEEVVGISKDVEMVLENRAKRLGSDKEDKTIDENKSKDDVQNDIQEDTVVKEISEKSAKDNQFEDVSNYKIGKQQSLFGNNDDFDK